MAVVLQKKFNGKMPEPEGFRRGYIFGRDAGHLEIEMGMKARHIAIEAAKGNKAWGVRNTPLENYFKKITNKPITIIMNCNNIMAKEYQKPTDTSPCPPRRRRPALPF